jgi:RNA polymerase sigma-70 factor (ECF subfamily)
MLRKKSRFDTADVNALIALFCFSMARMPARTTENGKLVTLADQDRSKWDPVLIEEGLKSMSKASYGVRRSTYHIEAGISGLHSTAKTYEDTDWKAILEYYNVLLRMTDSPIVALNRIVALAKVHGNKQALAELDVLESETLLKKNHLLFSIKAQIHFEVGENELAKGALKKAIGLSGNDAERAHLEIMNSKY